MFQNLDVVIMAGGSGTRFWPRSRQRLPKQLIQIVGEGTMLQQAVRRLRPVVSFSRLWIITHKELVKETRRQLPEVPPEQVIGEPCGRDTAACIALGAALIRKRTPDENAVMAVLTADHVIEPPEEFHRALETAVRVALRDHLLVTFGIKPASPSTLFGYIHRGARLPAPPGCDGEIFRVAEFREKPDRETAERYVASGDYYWNSGMFVWRVADIRAAIAQHMPELSDVISDLEPALGTPDQEAAMARAYERLPKLSIDYGVMEKAQNCAVIAACYNWDDVGSWEAAARLHGTDEHGNTILAEHEGLDTHRCVLVGESGHLIATLGVADLIVVQTSDATLICHRSRAADVKQLVAMLQERGRQQYL